MFETFDQGMNDVGSASFFCTAKSEKSDMVITFMSHFIHANPNVDTQRPAKHVKNPRILLPLIFAHVPRSQLSTLATSAAPHNLQFIVRSDSLRRPQRKQMHASQASAALVTSFLPRTYPPAHGLCEYISKVS
jgi:hypothetical protein